MRIARRNLASAGTVTASSTAAGYSPDYLVDGDTTRPWIAAEGASAVAVRVDLDAFKGAGAFEDWTSGVLVTTAGAEFGEDRSTGTGSTTEETSITQAGSSALKLTCTTGERRRVFRVSEVSGRPARPGEVWTVEAYLRGDGTGTAKLGVYDPITGKWWDPAANAGAGGWTAAETYIGSRSTASYAVATDVITLEGWDAHQCEDVDLEVHVVLTEDGQVCYFDGLAAWPHWDAVIAHGHNVPPAQTLTVYALASPSWGSGTLVSALATPRRPACYVLLGALRTERYCEVIAPGTHPTQLYVGELVVGQSEPVVDPSFRPSHSGGAALAQVVVVTASGRRHVTSYTSDARRELQVEFMARSFDEARDLQQALIWSTAQGRDLLGVIPILDGPEVLLARVTEPLAESVLAIGDGEHAHTFRLVLAEDGFPTVGL